MAVTPVSVVLGLGEGEGGGGLDAKLSTGCLVVGS